MDRIDQMAEFDKQFDGNKSQRRPFDKAPLDVARDRQGKPDILRAKDIIPSRTPASEGENAGQTNIPRFNLANDIMSEQRRLTAANRKRPARPSSPVSRQPSAEPQWSNVAIREAPHTASDSIIAAIVARDIERFCSGGSWV